jgi:hypothetical protein
LLSLHTIKAASRTYASEKYEGGAKRNIKGGAFPCMTKNLKNLLAANSLSLCLIGVVQAVL